MNDVLKECHRVVDETLTDVERGLKSIKSGKTIQVSKSDDRDYLKSLAYSWFHSRRPILEKMAPGLDFAIVSEPFTKIIDATSKKSSRTTYLKGLTTAKKELVRLRGKLVEEPLSNTTQLDALPDFSVLVADPSMQKILRERWFECQKCLNASAYLAATVMMGGLLEALFVAYANRLTDKTPMFRCVTTPKDKTGKPIPLTQWTLRPYIDVGHELGWISKSGKDVAEVLRDYRNYVHPQKQKSHGVTLVQQDAEMFWDVSIHLANQLLNHAKNSSET